MYVLNGTPIKAFEKLCNDFDVKEVYTNRDYEPYAIEMDSKIKKFLEQKRISFHTYKHQVIFENLLIDLRRGEAYFAEKLLDYELSSNKGNWQWAAGTGCDAAPYFRIFNPHEQIKKFDPKLIYIKKWIEDFRPGYLPEIVKYDFARKRALEVYKNALKEQ